MTYGKGVPGVLRLPFVFPCSLLFFWMCWFFLISFKVSEGIKSPWRNYPNANKASSLQVTTTSVLRAIQNPQIGQPPNGNPAPVTHGNSRPKAQQHGITSEFIEPVAAAWLCSHPFQSYLNRIALFRCISAMILVGRSESQKRNRMQHPIIMMGFVGGFPLSRWFWMWLPVESLVPDVVTES
jgi:hypothetical protein